MTLLQCSKKRSRLGTVPRQPRHTLPRPLNSMPTPLAIDGRLHPLLVSRASALNPGCMNTVVFNRGSRTQCSALSPAQYETPSQEAQAPSRYKLFFSSVIQNGMHARMLPEHIPVPRRRPCNRNHDSPTFRLVQAAGQCGVELRLASIQDGCPSIPRSMTAHTHTPRKQHAAAVWNRHTRAILDVGNQGRSLGPREWGKKSTRPRPSVKSWTTRQVVDNSSNQPRTRGCCTEIDSSGTCGAAPNCHRPEAGIGWIVCVVGGGSRA